MPDRSCVLVIGTTTDYIDWIRKVRPRTAIFVTSPGERKNAREPAPPEEEELLCDLTNTPVVIESLKRHLKKYDLKPFGIACFDCESMPLAASVAAFFDLPYPSDEAIENCRNKYRSKSLWRKNGIGCPNFREIGCLQELRTFWAECGRQVVLKPLTGSGSELVFDCRSVEECETHYHIILGELESRKENRLYSEGNNVEGKIIAEALIEGREYSCDYFLSGDRVRIIRTAEKIRPAKAPFGTIGGYVLPASLPESLNAGQLSETLLSASLALGLSKCICMADFMVSRDRIYLLEITPRPGGDCLPHLLRRAFGLDMLAFAVDASSGLTTYEPKAAGGTSYMGMRVHAEKAGVLKRLEISDELREVDILEVNFVREKGHRIVMPPEDYESWFLGHILFKLKRDSEPQQEYKRVFDGIIMEIDGEGKRNE